MRFATLVIRHEKGNKALHEGHKNARQVSAGSRGPKNRNNARNILYMCRLNGHADARAARPSPLQRILSVGLPTPSPIGSHLLTYTASRCLPPEGFAWTSHNLRNGATSATYAIGARLIVIRYAGGWFTSSTVLEAKYMDFTIHSPLRRESSLATSTKVVPAKIGEPSRSSRTVPARASVLWQIDSRVGSPCKWSLRLSIEVCSSAIITESSG